MKLLKILRKELLKMPTSMLLFKKDLYQTNLLVAHLISSYENKTFSYKNLFVSSISFPF